MAGYLEHLSDNIRVDKDTCVFCGKCVDTCVLDNLRMKLSPCRAACPMGVNVQGYVQLVLRGEDDKARAMIREKLPFPEVMCMVCHHPCEQACEHAGNGGQPVNIRGIKRYLFDSAAGHDAPRPEPAASSGKKVAVVGAGPAGLVAAYDLALRGHAVTVYEASSAAGGELRRGIPAFRLPADVLERELAVLPLMGVSFRFNTRVGERLALDELRRDFDAVILATGLALDKKLGIAGEELPQVTDGGAFLAAVRTGAAPVTRGKVVVIGGGNVAVDAAMTALRQGASSVRIVSLEQPEELPAFAAEISQARREGIAFECGWGPVRFLAEKGRLTGIELRRCTAVFDEDHRFAPRFDDKNRQMLEADAVLVAIGQSRDGGLLAGSSLTLDDVAAADPLTLQCAPSCFVAGDLLTGPSSVIAAMAGGREAAESAHRLLSGQPLAFGRAYEGPNERDFPVDTSRGKRLPRADGSMHVCTGAGDYTVIESCLSEAQARSEASRCYSCGGPFGKYRTCWFCLPCEVECPEQAIYVEIPYLLR